MCIYQLTKYVNACRKANLDECMVGMHITVVFVSKWHYYFSRLDCIRHAKWLIHRFWFATL